MFTLYPWAVSLKYRVSVTADNRIWKIVIPRPLTIKHSETEKHSDRKHQDPHLWQVWVSAEAAKSANKVMKACEGRCPTHWVMEFRLTPVGEEMSVKTTRKIVYVCVCGYTSQPTRCYPLPQSHLSSLSSISWKIMSLRPPSGDNTNFQLPAFFIIMCCSHLCRWEPVPHHKIISLKLLVLPGCLITIFPIIIFSLMVR